MSKWKLSGLLLLKTVLFIKCTSSLWFYRWPGSVHDSKRFVNSAINQKLGNWLLHETFQSLLCTKSKIPIIGYPTYFCYHAVFNVSSRNGWYKFIFSSLKVWKLLPQLTVTHVTIVATTVYQTLKLNLFFSNRNRFRSYTTWILYNKRRVIIFSVTPVTSEKKGFSQFNNCIFATQNSKGEYLQN